MKNEDVDYGTSVRIDGSVQRGYKALGFTEDVLEVDDIPERSSGNEGRRDGDLMGY